MNIGFIQMCKIKERKLLKNNTMSFYSILACTILISLTQVSYAQTEPVLDEQFTFSDDLLNDPVAQDLLKKIEQTRKMIEEWKQKEFEKNQAKENLEKMRDMAVERLNQDLNEWERLWEKYSARNAFDSFVSKKPEYVQGVFWDQFEFKEQKVKAGREALKQVLLNGGSTKEARHAYQAAAETKKIELIEMNAQFNVKHKLAYYDQQQLFNSTGQFHPSAAAETSIAKYYTDYRLDPTYLLANPDDKYSAKYDSRTNPDTECREGLVVVHRINQDDYVCIPESTSQIWERHGIGKIVDKKELAVDENSMVQNVATNPGTQCMKGYTVLHHIPTSEYRCVSESTAEKWINNGIGEVHDLLQYILGKDQHKIVLDEIYRINQEIQRINQEYDLQKKTLEKQYDNILKNEEFLVRQKIQEIIKEYNSDHITNEEVSKRISDINAANESTREKILREKLDVINELELNLKENLLQAVKGYENNPSINVDWNYLSKTSDAMSTLSGQNVINPIKVSLLNEQSIDKIHLNNIGVTNSSGQKFDEIKSDQLLQVVADITNYNDYKYDFVYMVEITNDEDVLVQPTKWITGTLNPDQTLNVGLSWIPKGSGQFTAAISVGTEADSMSQVGDIQIHVDPRVNISS